MSDKSIRAVAIDDPICPMCRTPTLGVDEGIGRSAYESDVSEEGEDEMLITTTMWWKTRCHTCKTSVERHLLGVVGCQEGGFEPNVSEEVEPTPHGLIIKELRELKESLAVK
jgi:hypothetical protein